MLVLVESIRRTLCTGSLKLKSALVSETAQVWIITSPAFTCSWGKDEQPFVPHLSLSLYLILPLFTSCLCEIIIESIVLPLHSCLVSFCLSGLFLFFLQSSFFFTFFPFSHLFALFSLLFPSLSLIPPPYALRSNTQQPLNYSHQTTLCIFCAVPLHPSRIFPCLTWLSLSACVCVCLFVCMLS